MHDEAPGGLPPTCGDKHGKGVWPRIEGCVLEKWGVA